jgi:hypothetical protein
MRLRTVVPLAMTGVATCIFVVVPQAYAATGGTVFTGAARALTADVAVQGAIDDALVSANGEGFLNCAPVGSPRIFETFTDPFFGHVFFAEADVSCTR